MAKAASVDYEHHIVAVRQRVIGSGNLHLTLEGYQSIRNSTLIDLPLLASNPIEPMRLSNFQSQRVRLNCSVSGTGDWFEVNRIIIYAKPVAVEYPNLT